jgi:hypothetical protein
MSWTASSPDATGLEDTGEVGCTYFPFSSNYRGAPVTTKSVWLEVHCEQTRRAPHSGSYSSAP